MKIEVDHRAEQLLDFALRCRAENHHWKREGESVTQTTRKGIIKEIEVSRRCLNCGGQRVDNYSLPRFELVKRRYWYAPEYKVKRKKGDPRLSKQHYVTAFLARELKELLK